MIGLSPLNLEAQRDLVRACDPEQVDSWFAFPFDLPPELTVDDFRWVARQLILAGVERRYVGPLFLDPSLVLAVAA